MRVSEEVGKITLVNKERFMKGIPIDLAEDSEFFNYLNNHEVIDIYISTKVDFKQVVVHRPGGGMHSATGTPGIATPEIVPVALKAIRFEYWLETGIKKESKVFKNSPIDMNLINAPNFDYSKLKKDGFESLELTNRVGAFDNTDFVYISGRELKRILDSHSRSIIVLSPMIAEIGESLDTTVAKEYFSLKVEALANNGAIVPKFTMPQRNRFSLFRLFSRSSLDTIGIGDGVGDSSLKQGMAMGTPCPPRWHPNI